MNESLGMPCIFITSLGRTGTNFFGHKMEYMIEDCTSRHEPDTISSEPLVDIYKKIREFGFFKMTVGKFSPRYSIRSLSVARRNGRLTDHEIVAYLQQMRIKKINDLKTGIYLEANHQFSGLTDFLPLAFPNAMVVYIVRDPRSWVCSWMNFSKAFYSSYDIRSWFKNTRLTPFHFKDDPFRKRWKGMTRFEKLCWLWAKENSHAIECAEKSGSIGIFKYEDLFNEGGNYKTFTKLLKFITDFPNGFKAKWDFKPHLLRQKVNSANRKIFPEWTEWSAEHIKVLDEHCRPLMERFNYGNEPEWQKALK